MMAMHVVPLLEALEGEDESRSYRAGEASRSIQQILDKNCTIPIYSALEWACWMTQWQQQEWQQKTDELVIHTLLSAGARWQDISKSEYPKTYDIIERHSAFKAHQLEDIVRQARKLENHQPQPKF